ncbi:MAG TPA: MlrC C-terminal domain-containing protein, partial [Candidatus Dormibacteraeota bacterium]|nr:MlrC C-terminal domain-containing protein [Candidatus Dormibacteraeota bacterium]
FAPNAFTALGMTLEDKRAIVVKSSHHFWRKFAPLATRVLYVGTPGALAADFASIPYRKRDPGYWPRTG